MTGFRDAARDLETWLTDGRDVLQFVTVLWCAGEQAAASLVWAGACARAEVVPLDDLEAEAALDGLELALFGLSPLAGG